VAFESSASNLVPGDTNARVDVFVHDRLTDTNTRVSVDSAGSQGDSWSVQVSVSANGEFIAFHSHASNLAAGDTNGVGDVFVHDRVAGTTRRASVNGSGTEGNGESEYASICADGRCVAFESSATNLVLGDTNGQGDIFVHDRWAPGDAFQPDALIHDGTTYIGNGIYNTTGAGQSHAHSVQTNARASYYIRFYNDWSRPDSLKVTGPGGSAGWRLSYYDTTDSDAGVDITSSVTGTGWTTSPVAPGSYLRLRLEVTPLAAAAPGATCSAVVVATSVTY